MRTQRWIIYSILNNTLKSSNNNYCSSNGWFESPDQRVGYFYMSTTEVENRPVFHNYLYSSLRFMSATKTLQQLETTARSFIDTCDTNSLAATAHEIIYLGYPSSTKAAPAPASPAPAAKSSGGWLSKMSTLDSVIVHQKISFSSSFNFFSIFLPR